MNRDAIRTGSTLVALFLIAATAAPASAALNAYLRLEGQAQGTIAGCNTTPPNEGAIPLTAFGHSVISSRDAASGLPTGKRQHKPITVRIDAGCGATPMLYGVLANNENLASVSIEFWRPSPGGGGQDQHYYTIELLNASIAGISSVGGSGGDAPRGGGVELVVSFTYQKITWTYEDGGITAEDDWEAPVALK